MVDGFGGKMKKTKTIRSFHFELSNMITQYCGIRSTIMTYCYPGHRYQTVKPRRLREARPVCLLLTLGILLGMGHKNNIISPPLNHLCLGDLSGTFWVSLRTCRSHRFMVINLIQSYFVGCSPGHTRLNGINCLPNKIPYYLYT